MNLADNLNKVLSNIELAKKNSKGKTESVKLVAVSKNHSVDKIQEVLLENHFVFGENRVQELEDKYELLSKEIEWHMIGHLQTNKVKYIADKVSLIHSLDRFRLAKEIDKRMRPLEKKMPCLIQVNIAKEESKFGVYVEDLRDLIDRVSRLDYVRIVGLMTIAPHFENPEDTRPIFKKAYEIFSSLKDENIQNLEMKYLSMGMSNDYTIAIEEGANIVRVGSGIFGQRQY